MNQKFNLIWANYSKMAPGQQMQEHTHNCHQLYYILAGEPVFIVDGKEICVHSNSCFLIPAATPHRMLALRGEGLQSYELKILIRDASLSGHLKKLSPPIEDHGILKKLLAYIVENYNCADARNLHNIECILSTLLMSFFINELHFEDKKSRYIITEGYSPVTCGILTYIEKNFQHEFSLSALAKNLNYNKNYLCTVFRKNTDISIIDYLKFVRIRQAVIFFAFYGLDVFSACESTGFLNSSYFSRTFKSLVGISPRDFRSVFSTACRTDVSDCFTQEPVLNYHLCSMKEAFLSLKRIGQTAKRLAAPVARRPATN